MNPARAIRPRAVRLARVSSSTGGGALRRIATAARHRQSANPPIRDSALPRYDGDTAFLIMSINFILKLLSISAIASNWFA